MIKFKLCPVVSNSVCVEPADCDTCVRQKPNYIENYDPDIEDRNIIEKLNSKERLT
jgi:hypothetical protein